MFIAIIGPRHSGKTTVEEYLVHSKNFIPVRLLTDRSPGAECSDSEERVYEYTFPDGASSIESGETRSEYLGTPNATINRNVERLRAYRPESFLVMNSPVSSNFPLEITQGAQAEGHELLFSTHLELLDHVTKNWRSDFVTVDLRTKELLDIFVTRPFFLVVRVDAPLLTRFRRAVQSSEVVESLEQFVQEDDEEIYGMSGSPVIFAGARSARFMRDSLQSLDHFVDLCIVNIFDTIPALYAHLDELNLVDPERLRPGWDTYFMQLASWASLRSNCMKRRVGALLVRNKRILATGYNGTPRGLTNCNDGGCSRCNSAQQTSDECVCLHAEENALLEAGRERVGDGAVMYCNTCPCLKCTIKIIQTGVREVVYSLSYKMDDASAALCREAGVVLRRHAPPRS